MLYFYELPLILRTISLNQFIYENPVEWLYILQEIHFSLMFPMFIPIPMIELFVINKFSESA